MHFRLGIPPTSAINGSAFLLAFWSVVALVDVGPEWQRYASSRELVEVVGLVLLLQMAVAYIVTRHLAPRWLDRGRVAVFFFTTLLTVLAAAVVNVLVSYFYLEDAYPSSYGAYYQRHLAEVSLIERLGFSYLSRYIVLWKIPHLALPALILMGGDYYRRQRCVMALREKQRAAELNALKSQLNPHFIFNTLNNIYALALQRSEDTAEAVAKLSTILDYVLHQGSQTMVSLREEVEMIKSYVALEQLRFSDRLSVTFENTAPVSSKVPPLLFLTLLENAFKHGVAKSSNQSYVSVTLKLTDDTLAYVVKNSFQGATQAAGKAALQEGIGLKNLRRQLALQWPASRLTIHSGSTEFTAKLELTLSCQTDTNASLLTMNSQLAN